jgi:hypothetical protein
MKVSVCERDRHTHQMILILIYLTLSTYNFKYDLIVDILF